MYNIIGGATQHKIRIESFEPRVDQKYKPLNKLSKIVLNRIKACQ